MPRSPRDPIKAALGALTFDALKHALRELPGTAHDPAHAPLEDCVIEVVDISDIEAMVSVSGHGRKRWYSIKVSADNPEKYRIKR